MLALPTAGLLVIKRNKLLLAYSNNKKAWYLPGGKVDPGETSLECLLREIKEELQVCLVPAMAKFYCHISAPAYREQAHIIMEQDCFLYDLQQEITACNEIAAVQYFDLADYQQEPVQVQGVLEIFKKLYRDKILL